MKAIKTRYWGPTDTLGARIKADDGDGNRITLPYNHALNVAQTHAEAAVALCQKMGWHGTLIQGSIPSGYVFVWHYGETITVEMPK